MSEKIAIIGGQTIGSPTEIYEALHGNNHKVIIMGNVPKTVSFRINNYYMPELVRFPETRTERRKKARKK